MNWLLIWGKKTHHALVHFWLGKIPVPFNILKACLSLKELFQTFEKMCQSTVRYGNIQLGSYALGKILCRINWRFNQTETLLKLLWFKVPLNPYFFVFFFILCYHQHLLIVSKLCVLCQLLVCCLLL